MGAILSLCGMLGTIVSLILIVIQAVRKRPQKKTIITLTASCVLFVVGLVLPSRDKTDLPASVEVPTPTEAPISNEEDVSGKAAEMTETNTVILKTRDEEFRELYEKVTGKQLPAYMESRDEELEQLKRQLAQKETEENQVASAETTQLYKDFFEPYTNSVGKLSSVDFFAVKKLSDYRVEYIPDTKDCIYKIYADNDDYIYMAFSVENEEEPPEEWVKTLWVLAYESNGKEISIDNYMHTYNKPRYYTYDPNRNPKNMEASSVEELIAFMFK